MARRQWYVGIALVCCLAVGVGMAAVAHAEEAGRGRLTLVVRDPAGHPLAGVTLAVYQDTDLDGRVLVDTPTTDSAGSVIFDNLPWGLYIVQFRGTAPDGRTILPADQQNLGLLEDGSGIDGGFGVRFVDTTLTSLFVLGSQVGTTSAVPMFDLAPDAQSPPQPIDPLLALAASGPTPTPQTLAEAIRTTPPPQRFDVPFLWCVGVGLWLVAILVAIGWWRVRAPKGGQP